LPQEAGSGQVAQGAFRPVACADLTLYLARCEQGRVFVKDKAQDGALSAAILVTVVVHGSWTSYVTAPGAFHRSPGPFVVWTRPS
jgi:hypothetical protein